MNIQDKIDALAAKQFNSSLSDKEKQRAKKEEEALFNFADVIVGTIIVFMFAICASVVISTS